MAFNKHLFAKVGLLFNYSLSFGQLIGCERESEYSLYKASTLSILHFITRWRHVTTSKCHRLSNAKRLCLFDIYTKRNNGWKTENVSNFSS